MRLTGQRQRWRALEPGGQGRQGPTCPDASFPTSHCTACAVPQPSVSQRDVQKRGRHARVYQSRVIHARTCMCSCSAPRRPRALRADSDTWASRGTIIVSIDLSIKKVCDTGTRVLEYPAKSRDWYICNCTAERLRSCRSPGGHPRTAHGGSAHALRAARPQAVVKHCHSTRYVPVPPSRCQHG